MDNLSLYVIVLMIVTYMFTFLNGIHDGCNVIATIVSSHSMEPKKALLIAAITEFLSPLIMGTAVAATVGKGIVRNELIQSKGTATAYLFILCAVIGAIIWNLITWWLGLPSSSSHALIGGLIGSGVVVFGVNSILWYNVLIKVVLMVFLTPLIGLIVGFFSMSIINFICRNCSPKVNGILKTSQVFSMIFLATSHSTNDSQKSMGIIILILMISGVQGYFYVPFWVKLIAGASIALGVYLSGWKIIKTVGRGIFRLKPVHSLASQVSAASVIFVSGLLGLPVCSSQIVSSSIMGVGSKEQVSAVKWNVTKKIMLSWITTLPAAASLSILVYFVAILF